MVQEKDAAKKRVERRKNFRRKILDDLERRTIKFRWAVNEHTPGRSGFGYYDTDTPAKNNIVSPFFDSKEGAEEWMEDHEPDPGKSLNIVRHRLVKREYTEWVTY